MKTQNDNIQQILSDVETYQDHHSDVVVKLANHCEYLINIINANNLCSDNKKLKAFIDVVHKFNQDSKTIVTAMEEVKQINEELNLQNQDLEDENRKLRKQIGQALNVWTLNDISFEDHVATQMANQLKVH